jgi:hypothetical protein
MPLLCEIAANTAQGGQDLSLGPTQICEPGRIVRELPLPALLRNLVE